MIYIYTICIYTHSLTAVLELVTRLATALPASPRHGAHGVDGVEPDGGGGLCAVLATGHNRCAHSEAPKVTLTGGSSDGIRGNTICNYM